mgnify:CR=1 FL=1
MNCRAEGILEDRTRTVKSVIPGGTEKRSSLTDSSPTRSERASSTPHLDFFYDTGNTAHLMPSLVLVVTGVLVVLAGGYGARYPERQYAIRQRGQTADSPELSERGRRL